jgi:hypothetical protein
MLCLMICLVLTPTYASTSIIVGPDIIHKQQDKVLTLNQINKLYSSSFGEVILVEEDFMGYGDQPGTYNLLYGCNDERKNVEVKVVQTLGNVIAVTDLNTIHVFKNVTLSKQEILDVLVRTNFIVISSTTEVTILTDTYKDNSNTPGMYVIEFKLATTSGFESVYSTNIKVSAEELLTPDVTFDTPDSSFSSVIKLHSDEITLTIIGFVVAFMFYLRYKNKKSYRGAK